ncbi:MAG: restriction endonuclease subunit S [Anaerolineales bacterium]|uniref:restriction endonuclease subunit S n=1 Tax=Candidatus Villigracilis proximus TaxID=3140683 RepID=UPI0031355843|nr:restriction endonuclease subunit S [Anaerolineales bacterium]
MELCQLLVLALYVVSQLILQNLIKPRKTIFPRIQLFPQINDILIHGVGTYRGQAALVEPGLENCFISRNIIVLRDISSIVLPSYLTIALNSNFVKKQLEDRATGSVFSQFSVEKLNDLQIPIPDLEKQKRLVEKISETRQKLLEYEQQVLIVQSSLKEQQNHLQNILENIHLGEGKCLTHCKPT